MERRDEFGRPFGDDFNRPYEADRNRFYERATDDTSLAWIGGLFAFMVVIGGLFYAFSGPSSDRVATNNTAPMTRTAPAPTPAPPPAPAR